MFRCFNLFRFSIILAATTISLLTPITTYADSSIPFGTKRFVSPKGNYYVIVNSNRKFSYVERRKAAVPLKSGVQGGAYSYLGYYKDKIISGPIIDPADKIVVSGELEQRPLNLFVLDSGEGFICFDHYGNLGYGSIISFIESSGKVRFSRTLADVLDL